MSPDAGGVYRAKKFREGLAHRYGLDAGLAMIIKQRAKANEVRIKEGEGRPGGIGHSSSSSRFRKMSGMTLSLIRYVATPPPPATGAEDRDTAVVDFGFFACAYLPGFLGACWLWWPVRKLESISFSLLISERAGRCNMRAKVGVRSTDRWQSLGLGFLVRFMPSNSFFFRKVDRMDLVGSVKDSDVIIVDDMIDTAGTLCKAASVLKEYGGKYSANTGVAVLFALE